MAGIVVTSRIALVTAGDPGRLTGGYLYNRQILKSLAESGCEVDEIVVPDRHYPLAVLALRSALEQRRPDVAIVDSIAIGLIVPLLGWLRQRKQIRIVSLVHALPSDLSSNWQRPGWRLLERRLLTSSDRIIAVSGDLRARLIEAGSPPDRTFVVTPGRDGLPSPQTSPPPRDPNFVRFLCVANWTPMKSIDVLVRAFAGMMNNASSIELVGETGHGAYARHVMALIAEYRVFDRVRIHGPLRGMDLARVYQSADVFILPSRSEGFGIVFAEAMQFGLPIVACDVGPIRWLVTDRCGLLVPPNDVGALTRAMQLLATDSSLRRRLGDAGIKRARNLPTWEDAGKEFARLIDELLRADDQTGIVT
jgi:glycosyltransferase involved in cell wall biosynthesis